MINIINPGKPLLGKGYSLKHAGLKQLNRENLGAWNDFDKKMNNGFYVFEESRCICCGGHKFVLLSELDKRNIHISYVICRKCGLVQLNPRCDQASYNDWYKQLYMQLWERLPEITKTPNADYFIENHFNLIASKIRRGDRILEVGCNTGATLRYLTQQGFNVFGCDYHENAISFAKRFVPEATIVKGGIDVFVEQNIRVDLIYMNHVLEHIVNPIDIIVKMRRLLESEGYVMVEVPGFTNWISNVKKNNIKSTMQFAHIYYFSRKILQYIFEINGFDTIYIDNTVTAVFKKGAYEAKQKLSHRDIKMPKEFLSNMIFIVLVRLLEIVVPGKIRQHIRLKKL